MRPVGHTAWEPVHSMILLPVVARAVSVPVVGAGGFCDGATLGAALALGACGIVLINTMPRGDGVHAAY